MEPASSNELLKDYGKHVFTGAVADEFLSKHGGSGAILDDPSWVEDRSLADLVAAAVLDWYVLINRPRPPPVHPLPALCHQMVVTLSPLRL